MAAKLTYYGQNDSQWSPDVTLTGDPGTDQQTLTSAGYLGGKIVALVNPQINAAVSVALVPCDTDAYVAPSGSGSTLVLATGGGVPFGTLINGPGEFAGAIGPSGSKKAPIVRAYWQGSVNSEAYDTNAAWVTTTPTAHDDIDGQVGSYLYCGGHTNLNVGLYTTAARKGANSPVVGICTHVPTTAEPWLGVASLL